MALMNLVDISDTASALANQLRAGIPMIETTGRLSLLQPAYAEFWETTTKTIEGGQPLSTMLPQIWPEALVMAVIAGEESGKLPDILDGILDAVQIQLDQQENFKKLKYPVTIILIGLVLFTCIMLFVVPLIAGTFTSLGVQSTSVFTTISESMVYVFHNYWMIIAIVTVVTGATLFRWAYSEEGKDSILSFLLDLPVIGVALRDMFFGVWARYMALMHAAGIDIFKALILTSRVMPERLRPGILAFEHDLRVNNLGMDVAANPSKQREDDPRREWPFYISTAFMTAERTGHIDVELLRVSPSLIKDAVKKFNKTMFTTNVIAMMVAGSLLAVSLAAIYVPLFSAISHAH